LQLATEFKLEVSRRIVKKLRRQAPVEWQRLALKMV
jgi:hypothetical protein